jgi:3-methyladenine DNA glycosylase AlkC
MDAKLTLKLDKKVINDLKQYAKSQGTSVSRLLESYAKNITEKQENIAEEPIAPWLKELRTLRGQHPPIIASDEELKADYHDYLDKKYR